jgi:glycosyltransferase involved in cell wall biosynthesis
VDLILTHPHFWPHVRRGAEREVHDLGARLAADGHRTRLLTGTPTGVTQRKTWDGVRVRYLRRPPLRNVTDEATFAVVALPALIAMRGDLIASFHYSDGWAAVRSRRVRRRPVVLKLTGTVEESRMAGVRLDRKLFREAVAEADEVWCNSVYAREAMSWTGREMSIVPAGVDLARFRPTTPRSDTPVVLCTSAADEPRKRLIDVMDAWPTVVDALPEARLQIAGVVSAPVREDLVGRLSLALQSSVDFLGPLDDDALVDAYSSATVTVAPAVAEALGLTTIESLACGTPVAGARSGATTEIVTDAVGTLFEPMDAESCAAAIVDAVALAKRDGVRDACRAVGAKWDWTAITSDIEHRFQTLLEAR